MIFFSLLRRLLWSGNQLEMSSNVPPARLRLILSVGRWVVLPCNYCSVSWVSKAVLDCISFYFSCSFSQPISYQVRLGRSHFPCFRWFFFNLEFSLARDVYLRSDWPLRIFWFWFYDTNAGSVLNLSSRKKSSTSWKRCERAMLLMSCLKVFLHFSRFLIAIDEMNCFVKEKLENFYPIHTRKTCLVEMCSTEWISETGNWKTEFSIGFKRSLTFFSKCVIWSRKKWAKQLLWRKII